MTSVLKAAWQAVNSSPKARHELFLLNRGKSANYSIPMRATLIQGDMRGDPQGTARLLEKHAFDAVVDWVAFTPEHIDADLQVFRGKTSQFVFISSASVYQKPATHYLITESTPLANPYWQYSRNKIACEERLIQAFRESGFPITIVRPALTYGPSQIPIAVGSWQHPYTIVNRMLRGQKVIVPGDGTSLWTVTWNGDFAKGPWPGTPPIPPDRRLTPPPIACGIRSWLPTDGHFRNSVSLALDKSAFSCYNAHVCTVDFPRGRRKKGPHEPSIRLHPGYCSRGRGLALDRIARPP